MCFHVMQWPLEEWVCAIWVAVGLSCFPHWPFQVFDVGLRKPGFWGSVENNTGKGGEARNLVWGKGPDMYK